MVQLFLSGTEIKWYKVESNSKGICFVFECRIYYLVVFVGEIPDFGYQITEQNISQFDLKSYMMFYLPSDHPPIIIVSPLRDIEAWESRGLTKLPRLRQISFLNSAITSRV